MGFEEVNRFIRQRWPATVRTNTQNEGNLIGLPFPYTVPCARDAFQELYYWDTYFASRGLALHGFGDQVKNNCDNFMYELEQFGFIPNGSRTYYLNRSQPPYFGALVEVTYRLYPDRSWLRRAVDLLEKEWRFWADNRSLPMGLLHYGHSADEATQEQMYHSCCVERLGMRPDADRDFVLQNGSHTIAEAESGWDFNPRFQRRCLDFAAVDLNALMYKNECLLADFHEELGDRPAAQRWRAYAARRVELLNRHCWCAERGAFLDYDSRNDRVSPVLSAASLQPLWAGLATPEQAGATVMAMEAHLECAHGLATCEKSDSGIIYQWDYPNGWPPMQILAMDAFRRYGYNEQARRIARKYLDTVIRCFDLSGDIWEKYNVVTGTIEVKGEYAMPAMMGWSAAAFAVAAECLGLELR